MGRRLLAYSLGVRHIQDCSRSVVLLLIHFRFSREPWSVFCFFVVDLVATDPFSQSHAFNLNI